MPGFGTYIFWSDTKILKMGLFFYILDYFFGEKRILA